MSNFISNFTKGVMCALCAGTIILYISLTNILPVIHVGFSTFFGLLSVGFFIRSGAEQICKKLPDKKIE